MGVRSIKATVRKRDGHVCTKCGLTNDEHRLKYGRVLDVHRISPGSAYSVDGCLTLCQDCHRREPGTGDVPRGNGAMEDYCSVREAADELGLTKSRIEQLLVDGRLRVEIVAGGVRWVSREAVAALKKVPRPTGRPRETPKKRRTPPRP